MTTPTVTPNGTEILLIGGVPAVIKPPRTGTAASADLDAAEIGGLYRRGRQHLVDHVLDLLACGQKLAAKRDGLGRGYWLPWLQEHREVLGFGERTARMLIRGFEANRQLTADLSSDEAVRISRAIWGNEPTRRQAPIPPPTIDPHIAVLVDVAMQLAGADVVATYIKTLDEPNLVSLPEFDRAVRSARQRLGARR